MISETPKLKPTIQISDLEKIDIRVGTIKRIEDIENSNKLIKLEVDFGSFSRTIIAGIKKNRENIQEIEGKQALFIINLEPRKMAGQISEGMLFAIGQENEIPLLVIPEKSVPDGSTAH